MSKSQRLKSILNQAKVKEEKYEWLKATELYGQALGADGKKDFLREGEIQERIGYCFHRAAFQAESNEEFKDIMHRAITAYEKTHGVYEKLADEQKSARMFRCKAIAKYLSYWQTSDPSEKREFLDQCLELEGKALVGFTETGDLSEYGKTYNELSLVFLCRTSLEWDRQSLKSIVERGLEWGEKAIISLSKPGDLYELARAYFTLATCLRVFMERFISEPEEQEKHRLKAVKYLTKAVDFLEKIGDTYHLGLSHLWWGMGTGGEESVKHFEKALECGSATRDNFLTGSGLDFLAYNIYWKAASTEDPEKRRELDEMAMQLYEKGQRHHSIISFMSPRGGCIGPPGGHAEHQLRLAEWETDLEKKLEFLEKSEEAGMKALKLAEAADMPYVILTMLHILSKTLEARAHLEPDFDQKRTLLEKALRNRVRNIEIQKQLTPFEYWNLGVMQNYLARIKAELADIEPDLDRKMTLLKEATLSQEKCLSLCNKAVPSYERMGDLGVFAALRGYQDTYTTLLTHLYHSTGKPEHLTKAIEISQEAIESASKLDLLVRIAESFWKIARSKDILEKHLEAAKDFEHASESYAKAAGKIPQLRKFYKDYALYMQAWSEIEKARHYHRKQEYDRAKEHYEKAAVIHRSLEQWSYLTSNYSAWALVEHAEDLSRKEQGDEARQTFEQAAQLFKETERELQTQLSKIASLDEKQMATNMLKATGLRHEYCLARIALEEARTLDKKGDHYLSSEKYGSATETFTEISQALESKRDQKEFAFLASLSKAWQKMTLAEAETSPALYTEASRHFEEARDLSPNEKSKMLMLGHSRFCKALEAGTRFEDTRDEAIYSAAKKHMEAAENYYLKAGFKSASEYAKATYLVFDAYMYTHKAETETSPVKKAQYYQMAEKLLQTSAGSYMKAKHPEKSEEVKRLLEGIKEKRQLAVSLSEVLHAPVITSTTTSFSTPTPTHEQAVGLERFEHADIQANLILRVKEVNVGEDVNLEMELINAGKAPALLVKVEEVIPESFEVKKIPEAYRVEDSFLNMKGRRLNPLKTEEVKMVVKPLSKGTFILRPRIRYLDENGRYKSHEPEPVTVTVKELGIKSWIKGER